MRRWSVAVGAALVVLLGIVLPLGLLGGSPSGAGDNGDGVRLFCGAGLVPDTPGELAQWLGGVVVDFTRGDPCAAPQPSSALLVLRLTSAGQGGFSLTTLGWVYAGAAAVVTGVAAWALGRRGAAWPALLLPLAVPLADVDFSRFLVSTFTEPTGLVGGYAVLCGLVVVAATGRAERGERVTALLLMASGGVLAGTAKPSFVPVLAVAAVLCALTGLRVGDRRWASRVAGPVVAVAVVGAAIAPLAAALRWQDTYYTGVNTFNLVYTVVLVEVPDGPGELGVTPEARSHAGNAYFPQGPDGVPGASEVIPRSGEYRVQAWKVLAANPGAAWRALSVGVRATQSRDLAYLPSERWTPETVKEPKDKSVTGSQGADPESLAAWLSSVPSPWKPWAVIALGLTAGLLGLARRTDRALTALCRTAGVATLTALAVIALAVLGDGYFEIAKHVWLAAYLLDVTLFAALGAAAVAAATALRRRRRPHGPGSTDSTDDTDDTDSTERTTEIPRVGAAES